MVAAAHRLADEKEIAFEFVGKGPNRAAIQEQVRRLNLENITFIDWLSEPELAGHIGAADICLGAFGDTPQSLMTVQHKIFQALAMRRPVITGESAAMRDSFAHGVHVYLCARQSGDAIAAAILALRADPGLRQRLAEQGYARFQEAFTMEKTSQRLENYLSACIGG
jgi:glycosyltransferase involved in cell wall biosynthesis